MMLKTTHKIAIATGAAKVVLLARRLVGLGFMVNTDRFRPTILIELSPYVHEEEGYDFADLVLVMLLVESGYRFRDANTGQELPSDPAQLRTMIPDGACINTIAFGN